MTRDPRREQFAYARQCALRRYRWLAEEVPSEDFHQTISLAITETPNARGSELARSVDRNMYRLARAEGFVRPSRGLVRGSSGSWTPLLKELQERYHA
jgi:hypothetical protein